MPLLYRSRFPVCVLVAKTPHRSQIYCLVGFTPTALPENNIEIGMILVMPTAYLTRSTSNRLRAVAGKFQITTGHLLVSRCEGSNFSLNLSGGRRVQNLGRQPTAITAMTSITGELIAVRFRNALPSHEAQFAFYQRIR